MKLVAALALALAVGACSSTLERKYPGGDVNLRPLGPAYMQDVNSGNVCRLENLAGQVYCIWED